MSGLSLVRYESIAALRAAESAWDDLWQRSEGVLPTGRASFIADWLEQFAPNAQFTAVAVEQNGRLVVALPLVGRKIAKLVTVGSMPWNSWCWAGDLLLDSSVDASQVLPALAAETRRLPWPLLWFDTVPLEAPRWRQFLIALNDAGLPSAQHERFRIGTIEIDEQLSRDWKAYEVAWSGNHRRYLRKALRRAEVEGGVEFDVRNPPPGQELETLLREGFEVEHRSWKGAEGTSVLACPAMWNFYLRQATQLASSGQLELAFLRHAGRAIAFEYGWSAQGVYYTPKVGFDSEYSRFSPGQLLRYFVLQRAFELTDRRTIDFLGPLSEATARWATQTYPVSRLVVETGKLSSKPLLWMYRHVFGRLRQLRRRKNGPSNLKILDIAAHADAPLSGIAAET